MKVFLPTLEECVEEKISQRFAYDPSEIESHTLADPEGKFYDFENRFDCFGLKNDIPAFSGSFFS